MTEKQYKRLRARDAIGKRARLTRDVSNSYVTIRAGTVVVLGGKHGGFDIQSTPCAHCNTTYWVRRVSYNSLELLEDGPLTAKAPRAPDAEQLGAPLETPRAEP